MDTDTGMIVDKDEKNMVTSGAYIPIAATVSHPRDVKTHTKKMAQLGKRSPQDTEGKKIAELDLIVTMNMSLLSFTYINPDDGVKQKDTKSVIR